jgi:hypothetical protein
MAAVVWASGFILTLYFTWVFHHAAVLQRRLFQNFILSVKGVLGGLMVMVLWDLSAVHEVWGGAGFVTAEASHALGAACVFLALSVLLLGTFRAFRVLVAVTRTIRARLG